jgi:hypothetical protein
MSVDNHIHAFPIKAAADTLYPNGVAVWDSTNKRLYIGDGTTTNGIRMATYADLQTMTSAFYEQTFTALTANGTAGFNGNIYVHHLIGPSGRIYVVANGDCYWSGPYTYVKMTAYLALENLSVMSGTWTAVFNPRAQQ